MNHLSDEDRVSQQEEREWKKEEKRRAALQKQIEAENAARKAAFRRFFVNIAETVPGFAAKTAKRGRAAGRSCAPVLRRALQWCMKALRATEKGIDAVWRWAGAFAELRVSIPVFILVAAGAYFGIAHCCGYWPFRLEVQPPTLQFYVCDYSVGFCTRLLVGAVIALFTDQVSIAMMNRITVVAIVISFVIQTALAGMFLRSALRNRSLAATALAVLFVTSPLLICSNMSAPGLLDVYLLILFFVWLALFRTPFRVIATPVICFIGMSVHYAFLFMYAPPIMTLLLYDAVLAGKRRRRIDGWISFSSGGVVSAGTFVWFVFFAKNHLRMTSSEFFEHMLSRLGMTQRERFGYTILMGAPLFKEYFDYYIFGEHRDLGNFDTEEYITYLMNYTLERFDAADLVRLMTMFAVGFMIAAVIWIRCAAREKGIRRFPYICFIGQAFVLVPILLFSTDTWRWVFAALMAQLSVFAVVYFDRNAALHDILDKKKIHPIPGLLALLGMVGYSVYCIPLCRT